jgi:hypothetical protein
MILSLSYCRTTILSGQERKLLLNMQCLLLASLYPTSHEFPIHLPFWQETELMVRENRLGILPQLRPKAKRLQFQTG